MFRRQLLLFVILFIIAIIPLSLKTHTKLHLAGHLSNVLLFPIKTVSNFMQFLTVSNARITELEKKINELTLENNELKKKITTDTTDLSSTNYKFIKAQIIGRDPTNINGFLYIDKGKFDGIRINQPAVSTHGLIGKIKLSTNNYSIVETIENQGFAVSAVDIKTKIHGVIKKKNNLLFDFIRIDDEVYHGDTICTSGMSEIFPAGIIIGTVKKISRADNTFFKNVYITPSAQINRLMYVYIITEIKNKPLDQKMLPLNFNAKPEKSTQ